jgi:hypothetical protein
MIDYATNNLGDVRTAEGVTVHLTQNAYPDNTGTSGAVAYFAHGKDDDGNDYLVRWETTPAWDALQEAYRVDPENTTADIPEDQACDWSEYTIRAL